MRPDKEELDAKFAGMNAEDLIASFPEGCHLQLATVFPGEYRIGYKYKGTHYIPGTPSYYPLLEALQRCRWAFDGAEGKGI